MAVLVTSAASVLAVVSVAACSQGPAGVPAGSVIAGNAITHATPPPLTVLTRDTSDGNGDIFIAPAGGGYPAGPEIVTTAGKLVWFHRRPRT